MKRLLAGLSLFLGAALVAQTPYYTDNFATIDPSKWRQNGVIEAPGGGIYSSDPNGGSLISLVPPPDGTGQYEVRTTMSTWFIQGTVAIYLGASLDALSGPSPSGQYYVVEATMPWCSPPWNPCSQVHLSVYKRVNGVVTALSFASLAPFSELRAVRGAGGVILVYVDGLLRLQLTDTEIQGGLPGVGVRGGAIAWTGLYPPDRTAPSPVSASSIASWPSPNSIDLQWQGASDPGGYGILRYDVYRNGVPMASVPCCELTDAAVSPSTTYTYTLYAVDYFLNVSTGTSVAVTTPPASVIDPRRTGVRPAGSYWGGAGERIDMRSGNLNFTLPLVNAQGRGGWSVNFALSYNSQLWRQDAAGAWKLGRDVGYGFGWRLMAGSITPYWSDPYTVHHYIFTDSTGAEYRLDVNAGGIWTTREGLYVEYDAAAKKLFFPDGTFWYMGGVSSGVEQDAGTRYPTIMQDTNGNQILVRYHQGKDSLWPDSSARINQIEDVRAIAPGGDPTYRTFMFTYNFDSIPHLIYIRNTINYSESYDFTYLSGQTLNSPFSPPVAFGTTHYLQTVTIPGVSLTHTFKYAAGAGELTKVTFPYGGSLRWAYRQFTYTGNRTFREVQYRYLRPSSGAAELTYTLTRDDSGDASRSFHAWTRLGDPSGHATEWAFQTASTPAFSVGLASSLKIGPSVGASPLRQHDYTWTQDAAGTPYLSAVLTTLDVGQSYHKQSKTEQTLDTHGNLLQTKIYDYGNLTTPARTYTYTYYLGPYYAQYHVWNRLSTADVTGGGNSQALARINHAWCSEAFLGSGPRQWVYEPLSPRPNACTIWTPGNSSSLVYDYAGNVIRHYRNGLQVNVTQGYNYTVPTALTPNSEPNLTTSMSYTAFLGLASLTEPNASTGSVTYDGFARPSSVTSPHGAVTTYAYTNSPPTVTATTSGRWTKTTMDGLGRPVRVEQGDGVPSGPGVKSIVDTEYAACACSPLGKLWRVSQPYAPGGTVYWTTNT